MSSKQRVHQVYCCWYLDLATIYQVDLISVLVVQVEVPPAPGQRHSVSEDRNSGAVGFTQPHQV